MNSRARQMDNALRQIKRKNLTLYYDEAVRLLREASIDWLADKFEKARKEE